MQLAVKIAGAIGVAVLCLALFGTPERAPAPDPARAGAVQPMPAAAERPLPPAVQPRAATPFDAGAAGQSCKPQPPLAIQAEAAGSPDVWTLSLLSTDEDREVCVWMGSPSGGRRLVWQGRLKAQEDRQIQVNYRPPDDADQVWASIEPVGMSDPSLPSDPSRPSQLSDASRTSDPSQRSDAFPQSEPFMRGLTIAPIPGRAQRVRPEAGRLTVVPETGESIYEFTGQVQK